MWHTTFHAVAKKHLYSGETERMWRTWKNEHRAKVRLTHTDLANGNEERAADRMNSGDGGLAKHSTMCEHPIDWEAAKIVGREKNSTKRKLLEGIVTLKEKSKGIIPLNS